MALAAASLDSQLGFTWKSPSPGQVAAISDCFVVQAGWPQVKHRWGLTLACTTWETPRPAHQWTATDHIRAPPPCPSTADLPQRAEVGDQWSQPVLAADWPEEIPPFDLPTATKTQLQEEGILSPYEGHTSSTLLG